MVPGESTNHDEEGGHPVAKPEVVGEEPTAPARAVGRNRDRHAGGEVLLRATVDAVPSASRRRPTSRDCLSGRRGESGDRK